MSTANSPRQFNPTRDDDVPEAAVMFLGWEALPTRRA